MANTVEYIYEVLDRFSGPLRKFDRMVDQNRAKIEKFSKASISAGKNLTAGITAPVLAIGTASAYAFGQFEASMASVSTLIDTNTESIAAMGDKVLDISKRVPVKIGDLTAALYNIRSAGVSAADAMSVLEGSARLATAGLGTTDEAVDLVTSSINAFNLKGAEQARVYDIVFKAIKTGKTTVSQLAQGFGAVAGTVANAGIKFDEYMASVAALTTTGLPAAQAHTQMRAAIAGLIRPSKEASAVFKRLGVKDIKGLIEKSGGIVPAFAAIKKILGGNDAKMLQLVGSTEALAAVIGLTGPVAGAFSTTLDDMRNGANAVDVAFEKQSKTFNAQMTLMSNAMGRVGVKIGSVLMPYIMLAVGWLERMADWFTNLSPAGQKTVVIIGLIAAAIGPLLIGLGTLGFALTGIAAISAVISLPILGIVAAIAAVIAAGVLLYTNWDTIKQKGADLWGGMVDWIKIVLAKIQPLLDAIGTVFKYSPVGLLMSAGSAALNLASGGDTAAANVAERRETQNNVNVSGAIDVRGKDGAKVERAKIGLNGGSNLATAQ